MTIKQWGFFDVHHLLWHEPNFYNGNLHGPVALTPVAERLAVDLSLSVLTTWVYPALTLRNHAKIWMHILLIWFKFPNNKLLFLQMQTLFCLGFKWIHCSQNRLFLHNDIQFCQLGFSYLKTFEKSQKSFNNYKARWFSQEENSPQNCVVVQIRHKLEIREITTWFGLNTIHICILFIGS